MINLDRVAEFAYNAFSLPFLCWTGTVTLRQGFLEPDRTIRIVAHNHPVEAFGTIQKPRAGEVYVVAVQQDESGANGYYKKERLTLDSKEIEHEHLPRDNGSVFCMMK